MSFLFFADNSEKMPEPSLMLRMRVSLYTLIAMNKLSVLYGPDQNMVLEYEQAVNMNHPEKVAERYQRWTKWYQEKKKDLSNKYVLQDLSLVENFLTIRVGTQTERMVNAVILFSKKKQFKKSEVPFYKAYVLKKYKFNTCLLIAEECTSHAKNVLSQEESPHATFQCLTHAQIGSKWYENIFVPRYHFMSKQEQKDKFTKRNIRDPERCPRLLFDDAACLQTFAQKGDFLECEERSLTGGRTPLIKIVT